MGQSTILDNGACENETFFSRWWVSEDGLALLSSLLHAFFRIWRTFPLCLSLSSNRTLRLRPSLTWLAGARSWLIRSSRSSRTAIETDQHGYLVMSPPPAPLHGQRQVDVALLLRQLVPKGRTLSECPVSTAAGVKAIDVAWLAPGRTENIPRLTLFERAPDICVEILSPSNSAAEIDQKRALYFEAGADRGLDLQPRRIDVLFCRSWSSTNLCFCALPGVP